MHFEDEYENAKRSVTDVSEQINEYNLFLSKNTNPNQPKQHFQNAEMESLDYEPIDNALTQSTLLSKNMSYFTSLNVQRWVATSVIGVCAGLIAFFVDYSTRMIVENKYRFTAKLYAQCDNCFWLPFTFLTTTNLILVAIASSLVVFFEPKARGSGIPDVKSYLNGVKMPSVLRLKTLIAKSVGCIFSVGGGLSVGKEGPLIQCGCIIGGGITQGKSTTLKFMSTPIFQDFRNDQEKRDFVSTGAAAGVAAAFGSPIGGVLFALEEGSSYWNQQLTWRSFFAAMIASFVLNIFRSGLTIGVWTPYFPELLNFDPITTSSYSMAHWPGFLILGVTAGFLGALFNSINHRMMLLRKKYITKPLPIFVEALAWAVTTSIVSLLLAFYVNRCSKLQGQTDLELDQQYGCPNGYFNDMGSVLLTDQETAIRRLFSYPSGSFSLSSLGVSFLCLFLLTTLTFGCGVSGASFIPCLLVGAIYGRFVGYIVTLAVPGFTFDPGAFALIGAVAFLGGVARMTIALTVIVIEATGSLTFGVPIMVTLMITKFVGDYFNEGLYDLHVHLKGIPLLEWEGPHFMRKFTAADVMARKVITFQPIERVSNIYNALMGTNHNGFPIVTKSGRLEGLMIRSNLITLLAHPDKAFQDDNEHQNAFYQKVTLDLFNKHYPRYPLITSIQLNEQDMAKYIDLSIFMNITPSTIQFNANLVRVFNIFRTMGLRHLCVVDHNNRLQGMITRKDLVNCEKKLIRKRANFDANNSTDRESSNFQSNDFSNVNINNEPYGDSASFSDISESV